MAPIPKKPKLTKKELWAIYGLNRPSKPRYEGLKGIYWHVLSMYVRQRDYTLWGRCISCNKKVLDWHELQGGHFVAAGTGGFKLLFDPRNVNGECGYCNGFDPNHLLGYEVGLDTRYGPGTAQSLKDAYAESRKSTSKGWSDREYHEKILHLQAELVLL